MEEGQIKTPHSIKNEFRDKVRDPYAGIPEEELVKRDQAVLLKEMRLRKFVNQSNSDNLAKVITKTMSVRLEILAMPKSPYREEVIADLKKSIENNQSQMKVIEIPRSIEVTLLALEELLMPETVGVGAYQNTTSTLSADKLYDPASQVGNEFEANPDEDDSEE